MQTNKTLIFYESRHQSVLRELEKKTKNFNIKLVLFTNSIYKKLTPETDHYNLNLKNIKFKDIKNNNFKKSYFNDIDKFIRDLSNNSHTFDDIINLEMKQRKYGYTSKYQAKLRLLFLFELFKNKLKKYIGQKVFVITLNSIDIERSAFYLACHSLGFKLIYSHSIPIKGNPIIFSEKMYSNFINNQNTDTYEKKVIIDGGEHAVSQIDRGKNPIKYLKRSLKEYKSNSLINFVRGYHLRMFIWQLERIFYNLINLLFFANFNLIGNFLKIINTIFWKKSKNKKNIVFIGSTNNEGFQFSSTKILQQDLILKELSKFINMNSFDLTYRPHPSSIREKNYLTFFFKILFMGIKLDITKKFKLDNNSIYIALTSSVIYEAFFNGNECYAMIPGFYNLLGLETSDLESIKFNLDGNLLNINNKPNRKLNEEIVKEYCFPGNLYYLKQYDIDKITSSFCNIVISQSDNR